MAYSAPCAGFIAECRSRWGDLTYQVPNCRKIARSTHWSQHAYNNAVDVFGSKATLDKVAAFARARINSAHVLWQVRDHYDHVHVDFHPQGQGLPNCAGGSGDPPRAPEHAHSVGDDVQLPTLRRGSEGPAVGAIQLLCNGLVDTYRTGWEKLAKDDDYGPQTEAVVKAYQRWQRLGDDGIVGPVTWRRILGV